jgi:uncharacterized protein (TIGR00661 family)
MTRVFWGVMGEGLGHVTRALAVIEHLPDCEVHIFSSGKALAYLERAGYPHLHRLEGLLFRYKDSRVAQFASLRGAIRFFLRSRAWNVRLILDAAERLQPDLWVTDFEPSVPVAAQRCSGLLLSVDNQHRFSHCSVKDLPFGLRCYAKFVGGYIRCALGQPRVAVVSTFCPEYLQPTADNVVVVDAVIRPEVESLTPRDDGFILAYARDSIRERLLACLEQLDRRCIVYGVPSAESRRNLDCRTLSPEFVQDLARCSCVVSTAGHQLISEACYLGKPILAIPEPGQYEQYVNAFYLDKVGTGVRCDLHRLTPSVIGEFASAAVPQPRRSAEGAAEVAKVIQTELRATRRADVLPQPKEAFA